MKVVSEMWLSKPLASCITFSQNKFDKSLSKMTTSIEFLFIT